MDLMLLALEKYLLKGLSYDFSVDYSAIVKCDLLNFNKFLMVKNNIK